MDIDKKRPYRIESYNREGKLVSTTVRHLPPQTAYTGLCEVKSGTLKPNQATTSQK